MSALNGIVSLTKVTLSRPAAVCPRRSDKSSVAKARSLHLREQLHPIGKGQDDTHVVKRNNGKE